MGAHRMTVGRYEEIRWRLTDNVESLARIASATDHAYRKMPQSAQRIVEPPLRLTGQLEFRDPLCQDSKHDLALEAREELTDARVNAHTEAHVAGRCTFNIVDVRIIPPTRIAICPAQEKQYFPVGV